MKTLKIGPCPWCKIQDENEQMVRRVELFVCDPWQVLCSCGARGPHSKTRESAIEKWNSLTEPVKIDKASGSLDERYCNYYTCKCGCEDLFWDSKYCPGCGKKLIWPELLERDKKGVKS